MSTASPRDPEPPSRDFDWTWADEGTDWVPPTVDPTKVSPARVYDYLLGGKDNFEIDRAAAEHFLRITPYARQVARANRRFMHHAVERMVRDFGIRQFIDLGTGVPTAPSVHDIARRFAPETRVLYVDNDPVVLAHNRAVLANDPSIVTILRDLREPSSVLDDPATRRLIDFDQPVGLLFIAVLHFVSFDQAPLLLKKYRSAVPAGSCIAISVTCRDDSNTEALREAENAYENATSRLYTRTAAQVDELFEGFRLVEPVVNAARWLETDIGTTETGGRMGIGVKD